MGNIINVKQPEFNLRSRLNELDYDKIPYEKMPLGSIVQIQQATQNNTNTQSGTGTLDTDLTLDFYPKFANSAIHIEFNGWIWAKLIASNNDLQGGFAIKRNIPYADGTVSTQVTDLNRNFRRCEESSVSYTDLGVMQNIHNIDYPNTTHKIQYVFQLYITATSHFIQLNNNWTGSTTAKLTAMEIKQ